MKLSTRVKNVSESITLKLNSKAVALADAGKKIYNFTAGQLPFRPQNEFVEHIRSELSFLKSFQYSPVAGYPQLRKKFMDHVEKTRGISFDSSGVDFDCVICNGGKHALTNLLGALVEPDDEVVLIAPHWISYPEMIRFCRARPVVVKSSVYDVFVPSISDIRDSITEKTKVIILNSPSNPSGINYTKEWMNDFAKLLKDFPELIVISDEIYFELFYYDPRPSYFYQDHPELLERTIIVDGISKTFASTGLRIGYFVAPKKLCDAVSKLQGQTTSGANSLVQRALINLDFSQIEKYLEPIKVHLRENSEVVREKLKETGLSKIWYQSTSAFYYLVDFSQTPVMSKYSQSVDDSEDYSLKICEDLLEQYGVAVVPGTDFGIANSCRISLVAPKEEFSEGLVLLTEFLTQK